MSTAYIETSTYCKKLMKIGIPEEQAKIIVDLMVDIASEIDFQHKLNDIKKIKLFSPSVWKEAIKTLFWTWLVGAFMAIVIVLEIVGIKHIRFT